MRKFKKELILSTHLHKNIIEAGCDEAGRGCLSGPVFAAAVILSPNFRNKKLNDSKKLSEKCRLDLRETIETQAIDFAVAMCTAKEVDKYNILWASIEAMHRAISKLRVTPQHLLIDGNRFKSYKDTPHTCIIKGDSKYQSIAAASILAKTYRDEYMQKLHLEYPHYDWINNKGYPTKFHRYAIEKYGITPQHRRSFQLLPLQEDKDIAL